MNELQERFPDTYRYEATRYAWKIKPRSVGEYPYVFFVTDEIVKEVYKIHNWYFVDELQRYAFNGELASKEISEQFVDERIPSYYMKKGCHL